MVEVDQDLERKHRVEDLKGLRKTALEMVQEVGPDRHWHLYCMRGTTPWEIFCSSWLWRPQKWDFFVISDSSSTHLYVQTFGCSSSCWVIPGSPEDVMNVYQYPGLTSKIKSKQKWIHILLPYAGYRHHSHDGAEPRIRIGDYSMFCPIRWCLLELLTITLARILQM